MQNKIIALFVVLAVLFSLPGFSQTTKTSKHPNLDKYYPRNENTDTAKIITTEPKPAPEIKAAPSVTTTAPTISTTPVATTTTTPVATTTTPVVTAKVPEPPKVQAQPAPPAPAYNYNRLGSSTKQYDTYEKNNNGAGSVTTSPK